MSTCWCQDSLRPVVYRSGRWRPGYIARFDSVVSEHILFDTMRKRRNEPSLLRRRETFEIPVTDVLGIAPKEEDDIVLATAVADRADYLVAGDIPFRRVGEYQGIAILTPREILNLLEQQDEVRKRQPRE